MALWFVALAVLSLGVAVIENIGPAVEPSDSGKLRLNNGETYSFKSRPSVYLPD